MTEDTTKTFSVSFQLEKLDIARRRVCGTVAMEKVDRTGEVMDYATARPNFEKWSKENHENSQGKSVGNLREMHTKTAAGLLKSLTFDDAKKSIYCEAEVVDDFVWQKCLAGVYSCFSMGGRYEKMWKDAEGHQRYTPIPYEVSLVDYPAIPGSTFEVMKDGGAVEMMKFAKYDDAKPTEEELQKAALEKQAAEDAAKGEVRQAWLDVDGGEHLTKAAAVKETVKIKAKKAAAAATAPLQKALDEMKAGLEKTAADPADKDNPPVDGQTQEEKDAAAQKAAADKEVEQEATDGAAEKAAQPEVKDRAGLEKSVKAYPLAKDKTAAKTALLALAKALGAEDAVPDQLGRFMARGLQKGLWSVSRLAEIIDDLKWLMSDEIYDQMVCGDKSENPANLKGAISALCEALTVMVKEEVAELTATTEAQLGPVMAYAALLPKDKALCLSKFSDNALLKGALEKAIGPADTSVTVDLKTVGGEAMEKMASDNERLIAENAELVKSVGTMTSQFQDFQKRLVEIESQPQRPKGVVRVIEKGAIVPDGGSKGPQEKTEAELAKMSPDDRSLEMIKAAHRQPIHVER